MQERRQESSYDVVIVGSGVSGSLIAKQLGLARKRVLVLEAGPDIDVSRADLASKFRAMRSGLRSSLYRQDLCASETETSAAGLNCPQPLPEMLKLETWRDAATSYLVQKGPLPFASTYERVVGGTARSWMGISLRNLPTDFRMHSTYGRFVDWPLSYEQLEPWYRAAEAELGVAGDVTHQSYLGITFPNDYQYPMPPFPFSPVDHALSRALAGARIGNVSAGVVSTPVARNSAPYGGRAACDGHASCVPICPSGARYDPVATLIEAKATGFVEVWSKAVASEIVVDGSGRVGGIRYLKYDLARGPAIEQGCVRATVYVVAAHGIETPKLLLMSKNGGRTPNGVANGSGAVGRYLMDHPLYLCWGLAAQPISSRGGPLTTAGIEDFRDGAFRTHRAGFRIEIGNDAWNYPLGDHSATVHDFSEGQNATGLNPFNEMLSGSRLSERVDALVARQFHLSFLVEQSAEYRNRVTLSRHCDHLGLPRPEIHYGFDDYTGRGLLEARSTADRIFTLLQAEQHTRPQGRPTEIEIETEDGPVVIPYRGGSHIAGTYRMGTAASNSVVDEDQASWEHRNLFLVGSGTFPTVATANPTLTLAALALRTAARLIGRELA